VGFQQAQAVNHGDLQPQPQVGKTVILCLQFKMFAREAKSLNFVFKFSIGSEGLLVPNTHLCAEVILLLYLTFTWSLSV